MTNPDLHDAMLAAQRFTRWALVQLDRGDRQEHVERAGEELAQALAKLGFVANERGVAAVGEGE